MELTQLELPAEWLMSCLPQFVPVQLRQISIGQVQVELPLFNLAEEAVHITCRDVIGQVSTCDLTAQRLAMPDYDVEYVVNGNGI